MYKNELLELINNENNYTISKHALIYAKELKLDINSLILLIYFINQKQGFLFDYKKIIGDLNYSEDELMNALSNLKDKKILNIEMKKNESGIIEEIVNTSLFYDKIASKIINEEQEDVIENDLFEQFEKEFGRTLSPIEYEIINGWISSKIDKELIIEALKEAVFNGVNNLRYIDKIIFEWNKKGIKKKSDLLKKNKEDDNNNVETYEYDWLNE